MIKFRVCISGKNAQGVAVSKHERTFTADLKCPESSELAVLEMVAKAIEEMARDIESAAENARASLALEDHLASAMVGLMAEEAAKLGRETPPQSTRWHDDTSGGPGSAGGAL